MEQDIDKRFFANDSMAHVDNRSLIGVSKIDSVPIRRPNRDEFLLLFLEEIS